MAAKRLGGFFLNDSPGYETNLIKKALSEAKRAFGRDKVFLSDGAITLIVEDQDQQDQQLYSHEHASVLQIGLIFPEPHAYIVRADRQKLLLLARQILDELDP